MAAQGNLTIQANQTGSSVGSQTFGPLTITANAAVGQIATVALVSGSTTVTVPTGATCVIFAPPNAVSPIPNPQYAGTITLKGISGDTGVAISNKWPTLLGFDTAPASFVVTATAVGTATVWFM